MRTTRNAFEPAAKSDMRNNCMARNEKKLRDIFEMPPDSGIFYIQYFDINGNRRREKAGRRSDAVTLLAKRKTEKLQGKKLPENLRRGAVPFKELLEDALEISQAENGTETTYNQDKERRYSARSSQ